MRGILKALFWIGVLKLVALLAARAVLKRVGPPPPDPLAPEVEIVAVADAVDFGSSASPFQRGVVRVFAGGVHLDLRDATPIEGGARLDLYTACGLTEVVVRPGWRVILGGHVAAGSHSTSVTPGAELGPDAPTLVIVARTWLGAIHVRAADPVSASA